MLRAGLLVLLLAVAGLAARPASVAAQSTGESIGRYQIDIQIERSGTIRVDEQIEYRFGNQQRHGIFRDIRTRMQFDDRNDRVYELHVDDVEASAGASAEYSLDNIDGGETRIKIGDADEFVSGTVEYRIRYRIDGAMNAFDDHDEFFWNVIGANWSVPIEQVDISVETPAASSAGIRIGCFAGRPQSTAICNAASLMGARATFKQKLLGPYEGVTVVVGLPKGVVAEPRPILDARRTFQNAFTIDVTRVLLAAGVLLAIVAGLARLVWIEGRDRRWRGSAVEAVFGGTTGEERVPVFDDRPHVIEYLPPNDMRPAQIGVLLNETVDQRDFAATLVDLAARGHLRIEETVTELGDKDWRLERLPEPAAKGPLLPYEEKLLDDLFTDGDSAETSIEVSAVGQRFYDARQPFEQALYDDTTGRGWFPARPDHIRTRWLGIGFGALIAAVVTVVLTALFTTYALVPLPLVVGAIALLALSSRLPRRTAHGHAMLRRVLGFRQYIATAETRRAEFAEKAGLFYEYLPYAVMYGCVDRWAGAFRGLSIPAPAWYSATNGLGPTPYAFAGAVGGFATGAAHAASVIATPGGSGMSGFSDGGGFGGGGGGGVGGGGGGGGGGSW